MANLLELSVIINSPLCAIGSPSVVGDLRLSVRKRLATAAPPLAQGGTAHTLVCWEPEEALLPAGLRLEGAELAARLLLLRSPPPWLLWAGSSASLSFSCSSFRKKSTNKLFSFLIWSLMSVGMSGIIQSTRTLRNITRFCRKQGRGAEWKDLGGAMVR